MSGSEDAWRAYLRHTRELAEQMLRGDDPYHVALQWAEDTMPVLADGDYAGGLYALWGALADWVELRPDEAAAARRHMVDAARGWLALDPHDPAAARKFIDRWLYDVVGHGQRVGGVRGG